MKTILLKVVLMQIIVTIFQFAYVHHYAFLCVFISVSGWFILVFFSGSSSLF